MIPDTPRGAWVTTDVPGRLDALGWSRWHQRLILALGITWILDGLEASLVANIAPHRHRRAGRRLPRSGRQLVYLLGQVSVLGAGHLTIGSAAKHSF
jgi:hypothetical protein